MQLHFCSNKFGLFPTFIYLSPILSFFNIRLRFLSANSCSSISKIPTIFFPPSCCILLLRHLRRLFLFLALYSLLGSFYFLLFFLLFFLEIFFLYCFPAGIYISFEHIPCLLYQFCGPSHQLEIRHYAHSFYIVFSFFFQYFLPCIQCQKNIFCIACVYAGIF